MSHQHSIGSILRVIEKSHDIIFNFKQFLPVMLKSTSNVASDVLYFLAPEGKDDFISTILPLCQMNDSIDKITGYGLLDMAIFFGLTKTTKTLLDLGYKEMPMQENGKCVSMGMDVLNPFAKSGDICKCLAIIDRKYPINYKYLSTGLQSILKERKNRYTASITILGVARKTRNTIIDANLLIWISRMLWKEKPGFQTI